MTLPLEEIQGKYEILQKIKEGGMGAIYKVRHLLLDEVRIIKVIRPQYADDAALQSRFRREARAAIRLRHPNIAQLYDFSVDEAGEAYMVMEFIDGVTLREMLTASGPPSLPLSLEIARQGLRALRYLHQQSYVHRDIAPDNLMLTRDFEGKPLVKLIDLGIIKHLEGEQVELTGTGMFLGKVRYSSPEQFSGKKTEVTACSDLYSFGVMLYEMVTGVFPFEGESMSDLIAAHLFDPPRDFSETDPEGRIPAEVRQSLMQSLEKDPAKRVGSAEKFLELLADQGSSDSLNQDLDLTLDTTINLLAVDRVREVGSTQGRLDNQFGLHATPPPPPATPAVAGPALLPEAETLTNSIGARSTGGSRGPLLWGSVIVAAVALGLLVWQLVDRPSPPKEAVVVTRTAADVFDEAAGVVSEPSIDEVAAQAVERAVVEERGSGADRPGPPGPRGGRPPPREHRLPSPPLEGGGGEPAPREGGRPVPAARLPARFRVSSSLVRPPPPPRDRLAVPDDRVADVRQVGSEARLVQPVAEEVEAQESQPLQPQDQPEVSPTPRVYGPVAELTGDGSKIVGKNVGRLKGRWLAVADVAVLATYDSVYVGEIHFDLTRRAAGQTGAPIDEETLKGELRELLLLRLEEASLFQEVMEGRPGDDDVAYLRLNLSLEQGSGAAKPTYILEIHLLDHESEEEIGRYHAYGTGRVARGAGRRTTQDEVQESAEEFVELLAKTR